MVFTSSSSCAAGIQCFWPSTHHSPAEVQWPPGSETCTPPNLPSVSRLPACSCLDLLRPQFDLHSLSHLAAPLLQPQVTSFLSTLPPILPTSVSLAYTAAFSCGWNQSTAAFSCGWNRSIADFSFGWNQSTAAFSCGWNQSTAAFSCGWNQSTAALSCHWNQSTSALNGRICVSSQIIFLAYLNFVNV